jgi:hypothetical protein
MAKRKLYRKPQLNKVKLVPEEAVLTACKVIQNEAGASGSKCHSNINQGCNQLGS